MPASLERRGGAVKGGPSRTSISEGGVDGAYGSVNADEHKVTPQGGPSNGAAAATPARGEAILDGGGWGRVVIADNQMYILLPASFKLLLYV